MKTNVLYYGDNFEIMQKYIPDESVDLVYLDPPFNSNRDFNVIFRDQSGASSDAQLLAFEDTWNWGPSAEATFAYLTNTARHQGRVPSEVSSLVDAFRGGIGTNSMMAYIVEMSARLVELHRVLKVTGSLYLHCDPTASHYLKIVLDAIFGPKRFVNEISWKRSSAHSDTRQGMRRCGRVRDILLLYTKSVQYTWNVLYTPYTAEYLQSEYRHVAPDGRRYKETDPTAAKPGGDTEYEWRVKRPGTLRARWQADLNDEYLHPQLGWTYHGVRPYNGRFWGWSKANLIAFAQQGKLIHRETGMPRVMQYADEMPGISLQDAWDDIPPAGSGEALGYPTQKPIALLERIIESSSNPDDIVLDPFCGCGTAVVASQKLGRQWIGIDITYLAIAVMRARINDSFGLSNVEVINQPTEVEGARQMAQTPEGRYQFQWWALTLIDALPVGGVAKKGADKGIDGVITFTDAHNKLETVLVSVKSGGVNSSQIRDLKGAMDREKAAIGIFITLEETTAPMRKEAATAGVYHSELWNRDFPRIQLFSIRELLQGTRPNLPSFVMPTYQKAQRVKKPVGRQLPLET